MAHPKNAIPTTRGWVHERTGELLKSQRISPEFIAAWHHDKAPASAPEPQWQPHPPQTLHEAPAVERELTEEETAWHQPMQDDLDRYEQDLIDEENADG
jgi:hypothetical protein